MRTPSNRESEPEPARLRYLHSKEPREGAGRAGKSYVNTGVGDSFSGL